MFLPPRFGVGGSAANADWLFGPLIVNFAVVAMADVARPVRFAVAPLAVLAGAAPFVVGDLEPAYAAATLVLAAVVLALALPRPAVGERYAR